jgi:hypothetical protein
MKFKIDLGQIKTREFIAVETSLEAAVNLMSKCMVDELGNPISLEEAREKLLDLSIDDLADVQEQFTSSIIPTVKGRRS